MLELWTIFEKGKIEMLNRLTTVSIFCPLILILTCFCSCQEKEECAKFNHEQYIEEQVDTALLREALEDRGRILEWFNEKPIEGQNHEIYLMVYYSSHGFGRSIKFEKKDTGYFLGLKCLPKKEWHPVCENYEIEITEEEWNKFEKMIYEFDFWTEKQLNEKREMLDGYAFFIEGNRPEAKKCNKRTYRFVARSSPQYDKIGALCQYISDFEDILAFRYEIRDLN